MEKNLWEIAIPRFWSPTKNDHSKFNQKNVNDDHYIATKKIDGNQGRFTKQTSIKEKTGMLSRTISKTTGEYVDNSEKIPHLMDVLNLLPDNTQLLIELHLPNKTAKDVGAILRCLPNKAIERQNGDYGFVYAYVADVVAFDDVYYADKPFTERREKLEQIFNEYLNKEFFELSEVATENVVDQCFQWIAEGYEGGILVKKDSKISLGSKKSWDTIKIKGESLGEQFDFIVLGVQPPTKDFTGKTSLEDWKYWVNGANGANERANYKVSDDYIPVTKNYFNGWFGALELGLYNKDGKIVKTGTVSSGLTERLKKMNPDDLIGEVAIITCFGVNNDTITLREPVFHGLHQEKNADECLLEEIFTIGKE